MSIAADLQARHNKIKRPNPSLPSSTTAIPDFISQKLFTSLKVHPRGQGRHRSGWILKARANQCSVNSFSVLSGFNLRTRKVNYIYFIQSLFAAEKHHNFEGSLFIFHAHMLQHVCWTCRNRNCPLNPAGCVVERENNRRDAICRC